MSYTKRIVCLANSFKKGGSCIAGREILPNGAYGPWMRPVSSRPTQEIKPMESRLQNGLGPKLLDIIEIPLLQPMPHNHQQENHVIEQGKPWNKVAELPWEELAHLQEDQKSLWINSSSTTSGTFNCMSPEEASKLTSSLALIKPEEFSVEIGSDPWNKRTYYGNFNLHKTFYSLRITDPVLTNALGSKTEGNYAIPDAYLCVSVTEPYLDGDHRCHKLVAAVITKPSQ